MRNRLCVPVGRAVALGLALVAAAPALAQEGFPSRTVKIIVPFTPGGSPDVLARLLAERLRGPWGQGVIVENRPGAGGNVGVLAARDAEPDGHTLLVTSSNNLTVNPLLTDARFEPLSDLRPLTAAARLQMIVAVGPSVKAATLADLIAAAKAKPGSLTYGSSGVGSVQHLATELFRKKAGIEMVHVPYRGAAPAITDLLAGRIDLFIGVANSLLPHIEAGTLRALATVGSERYANLPAIPTVSESGVPGYEMNVWLAVAITGKAPPELAARISGDVRKALDDAGLRAELLKQGIEVTAADPEAMRALMEREIPQWREVIRQAGIKTETQ
jgi:tripartite-type tricarboxylate transporter receptor subunit TctC